MDPITLIASIIAIVQALDRIAVLTAKFKLFLEASSEIRSLVSETLDLRLVVDRVRLNAESCADVDDVVLRHLLKSCESTVEKIESLIRNKLTKQRPRGLVVQRLAWARRKREVLSLRRQLQGRKAMLCLSLMGTTISKQTQIQAGVAELKELVINATHLGEEANTLRKAAAEYDKESQVSDLNESVIDDICREESDFSPRRYGQPFYCPRTCDCRCHRRVLIRLGLLSFYHLTGSITIGTVGNVLNPNLSACSNAQCFQRSAPRLLVILHPPQWLLSFALGLVYRGGPSPSLALYFPRMVPPDADIAIAIRSGNCARIQHLISGGEASPLDVIGPYGFTALNLAIVYGQTKAADLLLSIGAHRYATTISGRVGDICQFWTNFSLVRCSLPGNEIIKDAFHLCSTEKYLDMIQLSGPAFLEEGTPLPRLHKAILGLTLEGKGDLIRYSRSSINDTDSLGRTVLHWAVCQNSADVLDQLLQCGADPNFHDNDRKTPLHLAAAFGHAQIVESLIASGADLHAGDAVLCTPMHVAALCDHSSIVLQLARAGGDIEYKNGVGETPLLTACLMGGSRTVKVLLSYGANPDATCKWGCSALGRAIKLNRHSTVQTLLEHGAPTNMVRHDRKTLLHLVAMAGDLEMIKLLTEAGVTGYDVDAVDEDGMTALQILRLRKDAESVMDSFLCLSKQTETPTGNNEADGEEVDAFFDAVEVLALQTTD